MAFVDVRGTTTEEPCSVSTAFSVAFAVVALVLGLLIAYLAKMAREIKDIEDKVYQVRSVHAASPQ